MKNKLIIFAALFTALYACKQEAARLTSPSGFEYVKHTNMEGRRPSPGDFAYFHVQVRNGDSIIYRTRMQAPEPPFFQVNDPAITGRRPSPIEDVLMDITVGDSVTIFVSIDSLPRRPQGFETATHIIYDVVMIDLKTEEEFNALQNQIRMEAMARSGEVNLQLRTTLDQYRAGNLEGKLESSPSGLKYLIYEQGEGKRPKTGDIVAVHYFGVLIDGNAFDNSFERAEPITFPLGEGRVIPGWDEGIALLREGGKATLFIPAELGYGVGGYPPDIPPGAELVFYVELTEVRESK
jgi:FKBP-type peptidyl-prolyl cis-trans isomerase FkpA